MNEIRCAGCGKSFSVALDRCPACDTPSLWKMPSRTGTSEASSRTPAAGKDPVPVSTSFAESTYCKVLVVVVLLVALGVIQALFPSQPKWDAARERQVRDEIREQIREKHLQEQWEREAPQRREYEQQRSRAERAEYEATQRRIEQFQHGLETDTERALREFEVEQVKERRKLGIFERNGP